MVLIEVGVVSEVAEAAGGTSEGVLTDPSQTKASDPMPLSDCRKRHVPMAPLLTAGNMDGS